MDRKLVGWVKLLNFSSKTSEEEMEQETRYSPEIEEALAAAKKFYSNPEAQRIYEAQWRAELDRRYFERLRDEAGDAERDAERIVKKKDYIARRVFQCWNIDPAKTNQMLQNKNNYDRLNDLSEHIDDCEDYIDFLKLLSNVY